MIQVRINDKIVFKGSATDWEHRPPDEFRDAIKPGAKPQPWMKALSIPIAEAVMAGTSLRISVTHKPGEWTMTAKTNDPQ